MSKRHKNTKCTSNKLKRYCLLDWLNWMNKDNKLYFPKKLY